MIGAQFASLLQLRLIACGRNDRATKKFCNLNRRDSHPGACAKNQHSFSGTQGCASNEHVPRRKEYQWHASRLVEIEAVRDRNHVDCRHSDQFAVAAVDAIAQNRQFRTLVLQSCNTFCTVIAEMHRRDQHALSRLEPGHVFSNFRDLSRDIATKDMWKIYTRQPLTDPDIQMVERAGFYPHQHLILARLRVGDFFISKDLGPSELMNAHSF